MSYRPNREKTPTKTIQSVATARTGIKQINLCHRIRPTAFNEWSKSKRLPIFT